MTTTPPDDLADLFGLPPEPTASTSPSPTQAEDVAMAAEAALAAEMAAELALAAESGGVAADAPDSRTDLRVEVSWPARIHLPDGQVIELEVRNMSEVGVGLVSDIPIPASTVVGLEMSVPQPDDSGKVTPVKATIKTAYSVVRGTEILCGGTWQAPPDHPELVDLWIKRLQCDRQS